MVLSDNGILDSSAMNPSSLTLLPSAGFSKLQMEQSGWTIGRMKGLAGTKQNRSVIPVNSKRPLYSPKHSLTVVDCKHGAALQVPQEEVQTHESIPALGYISSFCWTLCC